MAVREWSPVPEPDLYRDGIFKLLLEWRNCIDVLGDWRLLENKDVEWNNSAAFNILMTDCVTFVEALLNVRTICCSRRPRVT
jgi:hypothetical protein